MIKRNVPFDVVGFSYYPKWHGTLDDLKNNLDDISKHYNKDVIIVEYSQLKQQVDELHFQLQTGTAKAHVFGNL